MQVVCGVMELVYTYVLFVSAGTAVDVGSFLNCGPVQYRQRIGLDDSCCNGSEICIESMLELCSEMISLPSVTNA